MFKNKEGQIRSGWKVLMMMFVIYVSIDAVFFIFDRVAYGYALAASGGDDEVMHQMWYSIYGLWEAPLFILQNIIMITVPIWVWKHMIKGSMKDMGLGFIKNHSKELGAGLAFGALSITLAFAALLITGSAYVRSWVPVLSWDTFVYLLVFIMVGIGEEVLGRGYIMSVLRQSKSISLVVIVSAAIFSLMHINNAAFSIIPFINIFLVGILFAYMYIKSGNIWMPIGYHITWNYFQGNVYGFPVSGIHIRGMLTTELASHNIFNGGAFGPEGGLIVTAIILIGFLFVKWYYRNKEVNFLEMDF